MLISVFLSSIVAISASGQDAAEDSITIKNVDGTPVVDVLIEGSLYTFLVDFGLSDRIVINNDIAQKFGLNDKGIRSFKADVDGEIFDIQKNKLRMSIYGAPAKKQKVWWLEQNHWASFDGVIGGPVLKHDRVIFNLSDTPDLGANVYSFDLESEKDWTIKWPPTETFDFPISYKIKLHHEISRANLVLTNLINQSGIIAKPVPKSSFEIEREFGVFSKAKNVKLKMPLETPLKATSQIILQVVPDVQLSANSDEIVVKAAQKKKRRLKADYILGRDYFSNCSKIEFLKSQKKVNFYCP